MSEHFFEIILQNQDFTFGGRDEVEYPLDETLIEAGVGEVTLVVGIFGNGKKQH